MSQRFPIFVESLERRSLLSAGTLRIAAMDNRALEGGANNGQFLISRTGDLSGEIVVPLTKSGTAQSGPDYGMVGSYVRFKKGISQIRVNIVGKTDALIEGDEIATFTLSNVSGYTFTKRSASITIEDATVEVATKLTWATTTSNPVGRAEAFGGNVGGFLYVFGGYADSSFVPVRTVNRFDPSAKTWTKMSDLPEGLSQSATAMDGANMYFAGGYVANGTKQTFSTVKVWKYNSTTDTYTRLTDLPEARGVGGLALSNNKLYYLSGSDSKRADSTKCWTLDLSNTAAGWQAIAAVPTKTNRAGVAVLDNKIYLVGGQQLYDANAIYQSIVQMYDPATNTWSTRASLPSARSHIMASTFIRSGKIIVAGGEGTGRAKLSKVDQYDPLTNTWQSLTSLPSPRFSGVGDLIGTRLYFSTGMGTTFEKTSWIGDFVPQP